MKREISAAQGTPDTLKNQYGKDTLRLRFADMDDGLRKLKAMGYQPKQNADRTIIPVQDCQEALKIINSLDNFIDFELIKGSMDDVFWLLPAVWRYHDERNTCLTGRTIKLYLKNPLSILFSFVYMLLFMVLISVFLGDYMATAMKELYVGVTGIDLSQIRWLVDTTSMAGVLMINCILVPLNVFTIMVQDSGDHRLDSFLVSAASRGKLVFGYWLAPFCVGVVMNSIGLFVAEGFIVANGGTWLSVEVISK